jgi:hypothetical protein
MTIAEFLLVILVAAIVIFVIYWYIKGSTGKIAITRPIESRVDEYLDQRFDHLMAEWSLVTRPKLQRFKDQKTPLLDETESKFADLKEFERDMSATLSKLEERLDALEKDIPEKGE